MARPINLAPIFHPAIVDEQPTLQEYLPGIIGPCLRVRCPKCSAERTYAMALLRQMVKRKSFQGYCRSCFASKRDYRNEQGKTGRRVGSGGYVELRFKAILPEDEAMFVAMRSTGGSRFVLEHRWVMAKHLGRALTSDENVHHKNGVKTDNRLENLELWNKVQPCGKRVTDLVAYAKEILRRYEPSSLAPGQNLQEGGQ